MADKERNCQVRMSSTLWNLVGDIAQQLRPKDARGRHSAMIREFVAAGAAKWVHSPYICRSAEHVFYISRLGHLFHRQVQTLKLNTDRQSMPCSIELKPEKRQYYHSNFRSAAEAGHTDEHHWLLTQWLLNHFSIWSGRRDGNDLAAFQEDPIDSQVDTFGTTHKSADLKVHEIGGRFLTREIISGLRNYTEWKAVGATIFDRVDVPIDIPTSNLEICLVIDRDLFWTTKDDELTHPSLEFRNRESARFEGREVALLPELGINEQYGRAIEDDGADEMLLKVRRLRQRISQVANKSTGGIATRDVADPIAFPLPQNFLFYWLRWASPLLGIEACVRWEKPASPRALGS
jgi:hypothetical protein